MIWNQFQWKAVRANDLSPFTNVQKWAFESLNILEANMVATNLIHRDFENEIKSFGETVNTRRPAKFTAKRKINTDDVTVQDATAENVAVVLDQHIHTSFLIRDGEESKSFKSLISEYMEPALLSVAESLDRMTIAQQYRFLAAGNVVGKLGTTPTKDTIIAARTKLNQLLCPVGGRNLLVTPETEGTFLGIADFINAEKVGDDGTALREGSLGRKFAFNTFMCQHMPTIATGNTVVLGAINNGNLTAGSTVLTVDGFTGALVTGAFVTIAGDLVPQRITAHTETTGDTTQITISPGLKSAVVNDAVVTYYTPGAINNVSGYSAGYLKDYTVDGFTVAPQLMQMIGFGSQIFGATQTPTTTSLPELSSGLESAIVNDAAVGIGPAGQYNFAFHRNAIALVSRPLALPAAGTGALSAVANYKGLGIRVTITYQGLKQGHLVTVDLLCGYKVLDTRLGVVLLA